MADNLLGSPRFSFGAAGKNFKLAFLVLVIFDLLSFWAHQFSFLNWLLFGLICLITLFLAVSKLEYAFYVLLLELFVGSKGYLLFGEIGDGRISLRVGIFIAIFLGWLIQLLMGKGREFFARKEWLLPHLVLAVFFVLGLVSGVLNNSLGELFFDANGWLYFLLVPVFFSVIRERKILDNIFSMLLAAGGFLSLKTLAVYLIFVHQIWPFQLPVIYRWLRESGVGEITFLSENYVRVFFQAQFYVLAGFLAAIVLLALDPKGKVNQRWLWGLIFLQSLALIISLSRSFWLGALAGFALLLVLLFFKYHWKFVSLLKGFLALAAMLVLNLGFLSAVTLNFYPEVLTGRFVDPASEAASASRLNQLKPLWQAIQNDWFLGAGFGKEVSYLTRDPRLVRQLSGGYYTTYAFDWGYLDIWLKIGLLGLLAYFWLMVKIIRQSFRAEALGAILMIVLAAVAVTHVFSPYLNHPLGIGLIMLFSATLAFLEKFYGTKTG